MSKSNANVFAGSNVAAVMEKIGTDILQGKSSGVFDYGDIQAVWKFLQSSSVKGEYSVTLSVSF